MSDWTKHRPSFEYDTVDYRFFTDSAWVGHREFAYDFVRFLEPQIVVELGTHWGTSFFSFCQAAKDGGLAATCYAVDTWQGDAHAGAYSDEVFQIVRKTAGEKYSGRAVLVRGLFDEALPDFADDSVNLLHIDGLHTYEAVSHDYRSWLPKLAGNGAVLFHDISVTAYGFGVYKLWEELKAQYPAVQFEHSSGLGILFPKGCDDRCRDMIIDWGAIKAQYIR